MKTRRMESPSAAAVDDGYRVRPYEDGDLPAIAALFAECFPHAARRPEHWLWKYHQNPWGRRFITLALTPDGELAAHYAGYAMPFWCHGRDLVCLQMGDTMTGPRFRQVGRGTTSLLARTVRRFFELHRGGDLGFYYGFNTGAIQRFCRWFIGGSRVEAVRYRLRPLAGELGWRRDGYRVERVERVGAAFDRLFRRAAPSYGFLVRRDAAYLAWRYLACPDQRFVVLAARRFGRLVGWGVFRRHDDRILWGDALVLPRHARAAEAILARAMGEPELAGASAVAGWFADRPAFWNAELDRLGFEVLPEPQKLGFMILPDALPEPPLGELYYAMGDGDLF